MSEGEEERGNWKEEGRRWSRRSIPPSSPPRVRPLVPLLFLVKLGKDPWKRSIYCERVDPTVEHTNLLEGPKKDCLDQEKEIEVEKDSYPFHLLINRDRKWELTVEKWVREKKREERGKKREENEGEEEEEASFPPSLQEFALWYPCFLSLSF